MPGLQSLIGNDHIKKILHGGLHFHAYLIEGEKGSGRHTLARIITQEALCESSGEKPCGICAGCKKFISGMHLDYIQIPFDIRYLYIHLKRERKFMLLIMLISSVYVVRIYC